MKVQDLYRKYTFEEIKCPLEHLFKVNSGSGSSVNRWRVFHNHWAAAAVLYEAPLTRNHIRVVSRWEGCSPMLDMNCSVYDEHDELISPLAVYLPDSEILSMEVSVAEDVQISEQELLAGLLWEMTYYETEEKLQIVKQYG